MIQYTNQRYKEKIEHHLSKFVNPNETFWIISSGTFQKMKFEKISKKIIGYNINALILSNNQYPSIFQQIGCSSFMFLLTLNLSNNCLHTVEGLRNFNAPLLENLNLDKNLLTSLKSLRKIVGRNLKILDISMNHITNIDHLPQFNCPSLKMFSICRNESVTIFTPYVKSNFNPPLLNLSKTGFFGTLAKKEFIDFYLRKPLNGQIARTKV